MANSESAVSSERVSFASLTHQNIGTVRKLNSVLFPVKYSDKYYQDILQPEIEAFCQLVYYNDVPVGNICCKLEERALYLTTLGILAPYRSRKLGSQALQRIVKAAASHTTIDRIYLHVQVSNDNAKKFYERHGFTEGDVHKDYYKKITPRDAWILEKVIDHPARKQPARKQRARKEPAMKEPAREEPAREELAREEPASEELASEESASEESASEESASEEPAGEESVSEQ